MLRGAIVILILGLIIAIYLSLPEGTLSLASVQRYQGQLQAWQAQRPLLVSGGYFLIYFLISALSIPGTRILTLLGGALFGIVEGTRLVASAASSGAVVAMLLSRYILRDWIQRRFAMMMNVINKGMADNGAYYLFAVRLVPVLPFSIINLLMGLTPFSTLRFMAITFVGLLPSIVLYITTGQKLSQIDSLSDILSPEIILLFMLLATLPLLSRWVLKRLNR